MDTARFGLLQAVIVLLGLITAAIHISLLFPDTLFILNGLGYLALLAAYFLPLPLFRERRGLVRLLFIGYTALTIVLWAVMNYPDGYTSLGWITKAVEVGLIVALLLDRRK
jgi:hypothetical protein